MIQLAMSTGLRASEFLGIKWEDIDFDQMVLMVKRSVVGRHEDATKTEASEAAVPLHPNLADVLREWRSEQPSINGWLFGSVVTGRPFHRDALLKDHLEPAAKIAGIARIGWHSFRHTFRALQRELEFPLETQQKLMRHASIQTTLGYGQDDPQMATTLRKANALVVEFIEQRKKSA
jgi:integrase